MSEGPWYSEALLASRLGVTRNALEAFRDRSLKKDGDWKKSGREVFVSQSALEKLLKKMGSPAFDCSDCLEKNGAAPAETLELTVHRVFPNPKLLLALNQTSHELVRVRVPVNVNFRPGMKLKAKPDPAAPGLYKIEGRCPRFPGRW